MIGNRTWMGFGIILLVAVFGSTHAEDVEGGFMYGEMYRNYTLHIPPQYNDLDSIPVIVNLHGGNGSPLQQATMTQMNPMADTEAFLVLYPAGTMLPIGYFGWNAGEWSESDADDVGFISALLDTLVANYRIDTLRIFATGFSMGAMMCHRLACELSDRIAAVAPVEGGLTLDDWNSCQPERLIPIMHFHHRYDTSVPYYGDPTKKWAPPIDSVMQHWAQKEGCDIGPDTFYNEQGALRQRWTRADDSCEIVFWTLEQGNGHAWPGTPTGSQELSANEEMWEFFTTHPLPVKGEEPGIEESTPSSCVLDPSNPNIFTNSATIRFSLSSSESTTLCLYDPSGRKVAALLNETLSAGQHEVVIDAQRLSDGIYFYRLVSGGSSTIQPIVIMK